MRIVKDDENKSIAIQYGNNLVAKFRYYIDEYGMNVFKFCDEALTDLIAIANKEERTEEPKQILVIRKDLKNTQGQKIRTGKIIAQACHASLGSIFNYVDFHSDLGILKLNFKPLRIWLSGRYTKVAVYVNSEEELLNVYQTCIDNNINVKLITDAGLTEFGGVKTHTCLGIGPDYPSKLDPLFRDLPLL